MFSDVGRSLDQDTIEYAWLLEIQLGKLSGKLTFPQLYSLTASLETLVLLMSDSENELTSPKDDTVLTQPPAIQNTTSPLQNLPQNVQLALQHLLQSKNITSNATTKSNFQSNTNIPKNNPLVRSREEKPKPVDGAKPVESGGKEKSAKGGTKEAEVDVNEGDTHQLKYKFVRVTVDALDFWLVESGAALQLWVSS